MINGMSSSLDSSESKPSKSTERKPSTRNSSLLEKHRVTRVSEMQRQMNQLQEELKKVKDERSQALKDVEDMKKKLQHERSLNEEAIQSNGRVAYLDKEVEKALESERKMLESMISQTKQLEQTKISLEEAKLEIRSLEEHMKSLEGLASESSRELDRHLRRHGPSEYVRSQEEIEVLTNELKLAMEAEEKGKKAMDSLAVAIREVTAENNKVKADLWISQHDVESMRAENERFKALSTSTEEELRVALEEGERLKLDAEDSAAMWNEKEKGFVNCINMFEEEISRMKQENDSLIDSQRVVREDYSKLRDILKQAVNEATVVKEAMEIARNENSQLKDSLTEKESVLQNIRHEYEALKFSEAAALNSVNELKSLLAATSNMDSTKPNSSVENGSLGSLKPTTNGVKGNKKNMKFLPERHNPQTENRRRISVGEPEKFRGSAYDLVGSPTHEKGRMFASVSNVSDLRVPSSLVSEDLESLNFDSFDQANVAHLAEATKQRKKKAFLRRFGDLLKRGSFHK